MVVKVSDVHQYQSQDFDVGWRDTQYTGPSACGMQGGGTSAAIE
jgi:hypothetical protein